MCARLPPSYTKHRRRSNKAELMHLITQPRVAEFLTVKQVANRNDAYLQVLERRRVPAVTEIDLQVTLQLHPKLH